MLSKNDLPPPLARHTLSTPTTSFENLPEAALIALRQEIDSRLTLDLASINMKEELALQFKQAKALYAAAETDETTPMNQKAQVLNSLSTIIAAISKTSAEVYSVERLKKLEAATLHALEFLPRESKERFFDLYEQYLEL